MSYNQSELIAIKRLTGSILTAARRAGEVDPASQRLTEAILTAARAAGEDVERPEWEDQACASEPPFNDEAQPIGPPTGTLDYPSTPATKTITQTPEQIRSACADVPSLFPVLTHYRLLMHIGEGAFGTVFLAQVRGQSEDTVAIKFFVRATGSRRRMLQGEVRQLTALNGVPGVVQLREVVPDADPPYFVMQYAEGGSLARLVGFGVPSLYAARLTTQVATTLATIHEMRTIHCDLKPANVLLDGSGNTLLADFGQAQLAGDRAAALGTFFYMAPEQADVNQPLPDARWDVYGLGAILYALVTGRPPRRDDTLRQDLDTTVELSERLRKYRDGLHRAPPLDAHFGAKGMSSALAQIIIRCLALDPAYRYRDAGEVLAALRTC